MGQPPGRIVEMGLASDRVVIQAVVGKYFDHLPLYRQAVMPEREAGIDAHGCAVIAAGNMQDPHATIPGMNSIEGEILPVKFFGQKLTLLMQDGRRLMFFSPIYTVLSRRGERLSKTTSSAVEEFLSLRISQFAFRRDQDVDVTAGVDAEKLTVVVNVGLTRAEKALRRAQSRCQPILEARLSNRRKGHRAIQFRGPSAEAAAALADALNAVPIIAELCTFGNQPQVDSIAVPDNNLIVVVIMANPARPTRPGQNLLIGAAVR